MMPRLAIKRRICVVMQKLLMSRTRSEILIRKNSINSSSYGESDECSIQFNEHSITYCCNVLSIKKASYVVAALSMIMNVFYFCMTLTGCGIEMLDIWLALLPMTLGCLAVIFLLFSVYHQNPHSLKPFIIYHTLSLITLIFICSLYFLFMLRIEFVHKLIFSLRNTSSVLRSVLGLSAVARTLVAMALVACIGVHTLCIHVSLSYYLSLDSFLRYISTDCTEIL